jgi:glutamyl-tRNA reductase
MILVQETIRNHRRAMALDVAPAVRRLQAAMDAIVQAELKRSQYRLRTLTPDQKQAIQILLSGIANKLLHPAIRSLMQAVQQENLEAIERICALFGVDPLPLLLARENESNTFAPDQPDLMTT